MIEDAKKLNIPVHKFTPEGAESSGEVSQRAESFFQVINYRLVNYVIPFALSQLVCNEFCTQDLCKLAQGEGITDNESVQILVVTHGGWIQCFLRYLHSNPEMYDLNNFDASKSFVIHKNTAVSKFSIDKLIPENGSTPKYKLNFKDVNNSEHLVDEPTAIETLKKL